MRALLPSGSVPTARVRLLISRLSRSMALFAWMWRQRPMGKPRAGERLGHAVAHAPSCGRELHLPERPRYGPGLLRARRLRLRGVGGLQHRRGPAAPRLRHLGEDVAMEMHRTALIGGIWEHLCHRTGHGGGLVAREHAHARKAAALQPREELSPALGGAEDLAATAVVGADGHRDRYALEGAAPGALKVDAVDEDVGVVAGERPAPPLLDGLEGLLVEVGGGGRRRGRPPARPSPRSGRL